MSAIRKINVPGVGRLPAFLPRHCGRKPGLRLRGCSAAREGALELVPGGIVAQTTQALRNIQVILAACGCELSNVAKVNVYLTDMASFGEMNKAYLAVFGADPPARITVGCSGLALGAGWRWTVVAFRPTSAPPLPESPDGTGRARHARLLAKSQLRYGLRLRHRARHR